MKLFRPTPIRGLSLAILKETPASWPLICAPPAKGSRRLKIIAAAKMVRGIFRRETTITAAKDNQTASEKEKNIPRATSPKIKTIAGRGKIFLLVVRARTRTTPRKPAKELG